MTAFVIVVALPMVWRAATWVRRRRAPSWEQLLGGPPLHRRPRRHRRIGDRRCRREAAEAARALVVVLAAGGHDSVAHLGVGVVLQPGERAWVQARARLVTWETQSAQVSRSRARWWGRRVEGAAREVTASGWQEHGEIDWLITSLRLVGRVHSDGELLSLWWNGLAGVEVDLDADTVRLDGVNGWRGQITGPGVAPIGVAAVAACHGPRALLVHPGLACLRGPRTQTETSQAPDPPALGPWDPMVKMCSQERRP